MEARRQELDTCWLPVGLSSFPSHLHLAPRIWEPALAWMQIKYDFPDYLKFFAAVFCFWDRVSCNPHGLKEKMPLNLSAGIADVVTVPGFMQLWGSNPESCWWEAALWQLSCILSPNLTFYHSTKEPATMNQGARCLQRLATKGIIALSLRNQRQTLPVL